MDIPSFAAPIGRVWDVGSPSTLGEGIGDTTGEEELRDSSNESAWKGPTRLERNMEDSESKPIDVRGLGGSTGERVSMERTPGWTCLIPDSKLIEAI